MASSTTATTSTQRYQALGLKLKLNSPNFQYAVACKELAFILKHAFSKSPKDLQSLLFQDTLSAFRLLPQMQTQNAMSAANVLLHSAESALPKQKKVLAGTEFKHAMVACKRRSRGQQEEEGLLQLPQDVLILVFSSLDLLSLASAAMVSRSWSVAASENHLWESLYVNFFGDSDKCVKVNSLQSGQMIKCKEDVHLERDFVSRNSNDWRDAFKRVYRGLSSKKFTPYRGYCRHCDLIVWLDDTKCYNQHTGRNCKNPKMDLISMHQIVDYVLNGYPPSESSSDSDSDSDDGSVFKLWANFR